MNDEPAVDDVRAAGEERWGETEFVPGAHVGLVGRLTVALIEAGHATTRERLWSLVASDAPIDDLLDELSSTGLKSLPSFAVAQIDGDDLRLVARGATRVIVMFLDGSQQEIDPSDVRTWREDVVGDVARIALTLSLDSGRPEPELADRFFVLAGSVPAVSLERRFDGADALAVVAAASWEHAPMPLPQDGPPPPGPAGDSVLPDDHAATSASAEFRDQDHVHAAPAVAMESLDAEISAAVADVEVPDRTVDAADRQAERTEEVIEEAPLPAVEGSFPPENSNETLSSIDIVDPSPVLSTSTPLRAGAETDTESPSTGNDPEDPEAGAGNYDFIYGHTVARSVEGAAVRADDEAADADGLISSVPHGPSAVDPGLAGDHDGMTVSRADLAAMTSTSPPSDASDAGGNDRVLAVLCGAGHPSAPHAANCRVCGVALGTSAPVSVPRPPLGVLVFSNGERVVADRTVLIGRNPRVSGTLTGELPRTVKLESAGQGLSRTHAEVRIEGWQMLLEDLQSTNGTEVTLPGQAPRRLHAGEPVALISGTTVDFGEELQCRVEVVS